jgi:cytoskeletal protein CcmA (bactofilin family)
MKNESLSSTTILGPDVTLEAEVIRFRGDVHVYGAITGDVVVESALVLAEGGSVDGDIRAGSAQVSGRLNGNVDCGRFDIKGAGAVTGVIRAERWSMEQGSVVEAEFVHADRASMTKQVPDLKAAYIAALANVAALTGRECEPTSAYMDWSSRLIDGPGKRRKFADSESVGRASWSKSVGSESGTVTKGPDGKRIWPAVEGDTPGDTPVGLFDESEKPVETRDEL